MQKDKQRSTKQAHKTRDWVTQTPKKPVINSGIPEGKAVPAPLVAPVVLRKGSTNTDDTCINLGTYEHLTVKNSSFLFALSDISFTFKTFYSH